MFSSICLELGCADRISGWWSSCWMLRTISTFISWSRCWMNCWSASRSLGYNEPARVWSQPMWWCVKGPLYPYRIHKTSTASTIQSCHPLNQNWRAYSFIYRWRSWHTGSNASYKLVYSISNRRIDYAIPICYCRNWRRWSIFNACPQWLAVCRSFWPASIAPCSHRVGSYRF